MQKTKKKEIVTTTKQKDEELNVNYKKSSNPEFAASWQRIWWLCIACVLVQLVCSILAWKQGSDNTAEKIVRFTGEVLWKLLIIAMIMGCCYIENVVRRRCIDAIPALMVASMIHKLQEASENLKKLIISQIWLLISLAVICGSELYFLDQTVNEHKYDKHSLLLHVEYNVMWCFGHSVFVVFAWIGHQDFQTHQTRYYTARYTLSYNTRLSV